MTTEFQFKGKYIIEADLVCQTGLHIGGSAEGYEIGGLDNPVIKTPIALKVPYQIPADSPYIPGSSLKGKLRSLLEWLEERPIKNQVAILKDDKGNEHKVEVSELSPISEGKYQRKKKDSGEPIEGKLIGYQANHCTCGECDVCYIFGSPAKETTTTGPTRLFVFDAFPTEETIQRWKTELGETIFTELKVENVIDRLTSQATPRHMERVPAGSCFRLRMAYDVYVDTDEPKLKKVFLALKLLEDSSLGGSGSRGSGRVTFENYSVSWRPLRFYTGEVEERKDLSQKLSGKSTADIIKEFDQIFRSQN